MTLHDELRAVLAALDRAEGEYALMGALAVAVWGLREPRKTSISAGHGRVSPDAFTDEGFELHRSQVWES